jgi:hypothetical protein
MQGRFDHRLVAEMNTVKHADGEVERPRRQRHLIKAGELDGRVHAGFSASSLSALR